MQKMKAFTLNILENILQKNAKQLQAENGVAYDIQSI